MFTRFTSSWNWDSVSARLQPATASHARLVLSKQLEQIYTSLNLTIFCLSKMSALHTWYSALVLPFDGANPANVTPDCGSVYLHARAPRNWASLCVLRAFSWLLLPQICYPQSETGCVLLWKGKQFCLRRDVLNSSGKWNTLCPSVWSLELRW